MAPRASASGALHGYRCAIWLDDEYCPVDAEVLGVLSNVVDSLEHAGVRVAEARPCSLREAERLAQRLIQAVFSGAYPAEEYERLRVVAETAAVDDDSPPVRHARNVTVRSRDLSMALEARAQLAARCATFFTEYDVLLCPITPTTAIPHDHQPDVDARRIIVNGISRPYGDQIPWASLPGVCGLPAVVLPAGLARDGLPVGLQVIGPFLTDRTVIDVTGYIGELVGGFVSPPGY